VAWGRAGSRVGEALGIPEEQGQREKKSRSGPTLGRSMAAARHRGGEAGGVAAAARLGELRQRRHHGQTRVVRANGSSFRWGRTDGFHIGGSTCQRGPLGRILSESKCKMLFDRPYRTVRNRVPEVTRSIQALFSNWVQNIRCFHFFVNDIYLDTFFCSGSTKNSGITLGRSGRRSCES
jgi:hypothetical protein